MVRDTALRIRILGTLALVLAVDALFVCVVAFLLDPWLVVLTDTLVRALGIEHPTATLRWIVVLVGTLAVFVAGQLVYMRRQTLTDADAHVVTMEEYPDLVGRVERLSQHVNVRPPAVAVADSSVPNSFTVGGVRNATIVVSTGLLETVDDDELEAVLAHELSHVLNRDVRVMTLASFLPAVVNGDISFPGGRLGKLLSILIGGALYVASIPRLGFEPRVSSLVLFLVALPVTVLIGGIALGLLATPVLYLARHLSRYREFAADRAGAVIAGNPTALASALRRLDDDVPGVPTADKREVYEGVQRFCLLPHGLSEGAAHSDNEEIDLTVKSHPPTAERIDRLGEVAKGIETQDSGRSGRA